jgi:hypothetical protein
LPARPWILSHRSCEWHRHSNDKRADHEVAAPNWMCVVTSFFLAD